MPHTEESHLRNDTVPTEPKEPASCDTGTQQYQQHNPSTGVWSLAKQVKRNCHDYGTYYPVFIHDRFTGQSFLIKNREFIRKSA